MPGLDQRDRRQAGGLEQEERHHARPMTEPRWDQSVSSEFVSRDACVPAPARAQVHVQDPAVLHVGRQETQRQARGLRPADGGPAAQAAFRSGQQDVALTIQRQAADPGEGFVVEIGDADVQVELVEAALDLDRRLRARRRRSLGGVARTEKSAAG